MKSLTDDTEKEKQSLQDEQDSKEESGVVDRAKMHQVIYRTDLNPKQSKYPTDRPGTPTKRSHSNRNDQDSK